MIRRKQLSLLKVIEDDEVELIHRTSLRILSEVGVKFPNSEMLAKFQAAGAQVDYQSQVVKMPEDLVKRAIADLPKDFSTCPADGGPPIHIGTGKLPR
jgi:trimethylamine--corrinoid protein Co-methyltransferase